MRVLLEPAFVLHTRAYRDTSLLVDLFTMRYGRLTLVARGVRKAKSRLQGLLVPFLPVLVSFSGKGELCSLQQVEVDGPSFNLKGDLLLSGFYLNELLVKLLPRRESYFEVYQAYKKTLANLVDSKSQEISLRLFENCLLTNLGYGLELNKTVSGEKVLEDGFYNFEFGVGVNRVDAKCVNGFCGKSLLALHKGELSTNRELSDAKRLLRKVFVNLLGNKALKSREMFYSPSR